jgi:beta-glucuronidase
VIALAATLVLLTNVDARRTTSLDGEWNAIVDPYENGFYDFHGHERTDGYFKNETPSPREKLVEYDFATSGTLHVPRDWNSQRESLFFYEGTIWYEKAFDYAVAPGRRVFLHFGAANAHAAVYVNGEKVGTHEGGYTPFAFEVTRVLHPRGNFVVVKVDNTRRPEDVPARNTDWWNYGGLTRSVQLVDVPETFIATDSVQLTHGNTHEISGFVQLDGPKPAQRVAIEIPEIKIRASATTDRAGRATFRIPVAALDLWSPEHPKLYTVRVAAETDAIEDAIGFRTIDVKGDEILLNGRSIFLRGVSMHEEAPLRGGRGLTGAETDQLLAWVKELGCNFVRLAHYPHDETTVRTADRLGLLVWSEIPVYWTIQFESAETYEKARRQLEENVTRDRNRASVIIWSVANETPRSDARYDFLGRLADEARRLDPTRLVSAALLASNEGGDIVLDDPLAERLDVIGCNEYIGWYGGAPPEKAAVTKWRDPSGKPLVISEFGADARYGRHGDAETRFTEEYQERVYAQQIAMLRGIPFLSGTSPWILMDFRSPRRPLPGIQDYWNRKGLLSEKGEKKKAFAVLQRFYAEKAGHHP